MDRRTFVRFGLLGSAAGSLMPALVRADAPQTADPLANDMAGGVFYTKDAPGRWSKKVGGHIPHISKKVNGNGEVEITVRTKHGMPGYNHYIVKHRLLDRNFNFIAEHMFDPDKDDKPVSSFDIGKYSGPLYAMSVCNKHDSWIDVIEV